MSACALSTVITSSSPHNTLYLHISSTVRLMLNTIISEINSKKKYEVVELSDTEKDKLSENQKKIISLQEIFRETIKNLL